MKDMIIEDIKEDLLEMVDEDYKEGVQRYFNNEIDNYGIRTPKVRKIAKEYFKEINDRSKDVILDLCEELLQTGISENYTIAFQWAYRIKNRYEKEDFDRFESWLEKYVNNWGACDDFCTHAFGYFVYEYPEYISDVKEWTKSDNMWKRRAAAVIMIYSIRKEKHLDDILEIADLLFYDDEDLVQKGYGWMLKEASKNYEKEVFDYIMKNKDDMPRTSLRYAIEKMPGEMREKAMEK